MNTTEVWRDIAGYEGLYQIGSFASVRKFYKTKKEFKPISTRQLPTGYIHCRLQTKNKRQNKYIHRLVAEAFIPNPENKPCVDHIDGNVKNNCVDNLRWCTVKENANNPITRQRKSASKKANFPAFIIKHPSFRTHGWIEKAVFCIELGLFFESIDKASAALNIDKSSIGKASKGRYKTSGGYHWRYATADEIEQGKKAVAK